MSAAIIASGVNLGYEKNRDVIKNASFEIKERDFTFITGVSGSGKSTLLRAMYGNLPVKAGLLNVCGHSLSGAQKTTIRQLRGEIGIVFQDYKLIKDQTIEENISLPLIIKGCSKEMCAEQTEKLLKHIELSHKAKRKPEELSGGEQQRVALARALSIQPKIIFADEPTGNLDDYSSAMIWGLLKGANEHLDATIVVVTHRMPSAKINNRQRHLVIKDGRVNANDI